MLEHMMKKNDQEEALFELALELAQEMPIQHYVHFKDGVLHTTRATNSLTSWLKERA